MQTRQFALHLLVRLKTAISKIIDNKVTDGSRNREYNYDKLGRLTKVKGGVNGTLWNQQYAYDRWGNRTGITQTGTSGSGGAFIPLDGLASLSYNTATNRITSTNFAYDAAGNQTQSNENGQINTYKYDAAGRLVEVSSGGLTHTYAYGASNQRLQMVEAGAQGSTTLYVWAGGQTIAEYNGVGSGMAWTKSYVYLGGRLLATDSTSGVQYHHPDRLGTRLVTNTSGGIVSENIGLPFGTTITGESNNLAGSDSKKRFTSYDRSDNTRLDYAVNRHYSAAQGRFTQVDPIGMNAVSLTNPQSLNLYAYCFNDPVNHVDPEGLFIEAGAGGALGGVVGAIIGAVLGALRVIFGGRGPRTRMGARIERRLPPNETGNRRSGGRSSVRPGTGAVNRCFDEDIGVWRINEQGELVLVINSPDDPVRMGPAPPENSSWGILLLDWMNGSGKDHRIFGPGSSMAEGMRTSPEIDYHRAQYCKDGPRVGPMQQRRFGLYGWGLDSVVSVGMPHNPLTIGIRGTRSADGLVRAGLNGPRQFVVSFRLKITRTVDGGALFELYNETSLTSFFGGFSPSVSRGNSWLNLPGSTIKQTIWWKESNPCGK